MQISFKGIHEFKVGDSSTSQAKKKEIINALQEEFQNDGSVKKLELNPEKGTGSFTVPDIVDSAFINHLYLLVVKDHKVPITINDKNFNPKN